MNHVLRSPHVDLSSILTQQNPSIDLRVHVYENSTRNFLKALTTYKNRAMTNIAERRKHQAMERKRLLDRTQAVEMETNQCKLKEIELVARMLFFSFTTVTPSQSIQALSRRRKKEKMESYQRPRSNVN
jgi:kinetochore protein Spc25